MDFECVMNPERAKGLAVTIGKVYNFNHIGNHDKFPYKFINDDNCFHELSSPFLLKHFKKVVFTGTLLVLRCSTPSVFPNYKLYFKEGQIYIFRFSSEGKHYFFDPKNSYYVDISVIDNKFTTNNAVPVIKVRTKLNLRADI